MRGAPCAGPVRGVVFAERNLSPRAGFEALGEVME